MMENHDYVSTTNACKLCKPLGACLAFRRDGDEVLVALRGDVVDLNFDLFLLGPGIDDVGGGRTDESFLPSERTLFTPPDNHVSLSQDPARHRHRQLTQPLVKYVLIEAEVGEGERPLVRVRR